MGVTEIEEGEAYSYRNHHDVDDDDYAVDPDVSLSYIDEKIEDVLGHFQKDFEGGVSAENLGAKFGGYGSFLPTYQRSPVTQHLQTPQKICSSNTLRSQNSPQLEGIQTNSIVPSSASLLLSMGSTSATSPSTNPLKDSANVFSKRNERMSSGPCAEVSSSGREPDTNFSHASERSLRARIKVGSDNLSAEKNAEMYSGLGLDTHSVSTDGSPVMSEGLHGPFNPPEESPTSILQIMTSSPVHGNPLLSPLPHDLIFLSEKKRFQGERIHRSHQQASDAKHGARVKGGNKPKSSRKNDFQLELKNNVNKDFQNGNGLLLKKERHVSHLADRGLVEDSEIGNKVKRECSSDILKSENLEAGSIREAGLVDLPSGRSGMVFKEEKVESRNDLSVYPRKDGYHKGEINEVSTTADSDVRYGNKAQSFGFVDRSELRATSLDKDCLSNKTKKKSKGSRSQVVHNAEIAKGSSKMDTSLAPMGRESKHVGEVDDSKPQKDLGKVRDTYRDFFGDMELEQDDDDVDSEAKILNHIPGEFKAVEKSACTVIPKVTSCNKKREKSSISIPKESPKAAATEDPTIDFGPISEEVTGTGASAPFVKEDWVCCDKCHKWRLLPLGTNPDNLPEKWLCSMLDWLPGMNRCSFSEEETNKALADHHQLPAPSGDPHGFSLIDAGVFDDGEKRNGGIDGSASAKQDFHHISNSVKNNIQASVKGEIRRKRDAEPGWSSVSKKAKVDDDWMSDHDRPSKNLEPISRSDLPLVAVEKNQHKNDDPHSRDRKRDINNRSKVPSRNSLHQTTEKKRKSESRVLLEAASKNDDRKEKKTRVSESALGVDTSGSKGSGGSKTTRSIKEQQFGPDLGMKSLKRDLGSMQPSQATSSSSKISGSHKATIFKEVKGSPVGSVSSSPVRFLIQDKCASMRSFDGKDDFGDAALFTTGSEAKILPSSEVANSCADDATDIMHNGNQHPPKPESLNQLVKEEQRNKKQSYTNMSRPKKSEKGSLSRSKSKNGNSQTQRDQGEYQTSNSCDEYLDHTPYGDKRRPLKNCVLEQVVSDSPVVEQALHVDKEDYEIFAENSMRDGQIIYRGNNKLDDKVDDSRLDQKLNLQPARDGIYLEGVLPHELPLAGRGQSDTEERSLHLAPGARKENEPKSSVTDGITTGNTLKAPKPTRRPEKKSGNQSSKSAHLTPNGHKINDVGAPSPAKRDSSSQAGNTALKEAKDLKHLADRLKNSGSSAEGTSLYFQAALKFLHGASLLESCNSESAKKSEMVVAMQVYSSTAKLCEFCAREYERCKDFATAALAFKLMEVAYMRVIYFSNTNASNDRHELQTALQIVPLGESPSSSVSEIDNLNNPSTINKTPLVNGVGSPQVIDNHSISARTRPSLARVLNFAQDVNHAMEASRKSRNAFAAASSRAKESQGKEGISSVKKALDFNFHDMERLVRLVRLAMDGISH